MAIGIDKRCLGCVFIRYKKASSKKSKIKKNIVTVFDKRQHFATSKDPICVYLYLSIWVFSMSVEYLLSFVLSFYLFSMQTALSWLQRSHSYNCMLFLKRCLNDKVKRIHWRKTELKRVGGKIVYIYRNFLKKTKNLDTKKKWQYGWWFLWQWKIFAHFKLNAFRIVSALQSNSIILFICLVTFF